MPHAPQTEEARRASDIVLDSPLLRIAPASVRPYLKLARIDRPIGTWLLLFPCWWSLSLGLAAPSLAPIDPWNAAYQALLFAIGALVMRGAGCTINDIADRDFDARVARTAGRPLPSGQISLIQALAFLALQLLAGLGVLLQFNDTTIWLGIAALALVIPYPFMKRITYWPQAWLGLTFNWGALLGWTAVHGSLDWPPVLLYLAGIAWTLGYDTIYAHQDKEDDALIGVKSSALKLGRNTKPWLIFFYAVSTILFLASGALAGLSWPFWLALAVIAGQFAWQIRAVELDDPADCLAKFNSNRMVGWLFLMGAVGAILAS